MSKAEALREAQRSLLTGNVQGNGSDSQRGSVIFTPGQGQTATIKRDLSHPYYWAPFILMGNGL